MLDLGLPDGDGVDLIRDVRGWSAVPIIVLSARTDEADKIEALDAGADDYLTKPFGVGELLARVRATLRRRPARRRRRHAGIVPLRRRARSISYRRVVRKGERRVHLTPIEYRLLALLVANAGRVLTHRQILREVWGPSHVEHEPLRAHLHGPPAPEARGRSGAAHAPGDRDRRRLPARRLI